ncbi:hypothetical protein ACOZ4Y_08380 [Komagataeibacter rhaeticus]|uniref:Uncharacterized protein n=1 Tax=Komagataeibacter rhaeticus TaxID=215221 RepID=A0A181CE25_9PROT|nr:hypothetical protein [Komagataeibacter rhaeticus]MBL7240371.1 hypothetical protein [Komagataeibacter rhaeticus]QIP36448.1 hypothetical protein GWK63_14085 [Komagataeibacter rhaeticus]QOC46218.1 hypothetical protein ICJ78_14145 [Komagataeibacter rhaeticus]WPP21148.1 hypothetical protein SCD25_12050 [Komagataeibacter rhaeticus]SAY49806.1 hypothetical protein KRIGEM_02790 [Komagataeibacter rhaeticus]
MAFESIVLSDTVHQHDDRPVRSGTPPLRSPVRGIVFGLALSAPFWALVAFLIFR